MYIAIINYNMGNISSVKNAFKRIGVDIRVTSSVRVINNAGALVLPGVGAYKDAYKNLEKLNMIKVLKENIRKKVFLGICLGMQLLFDYSLEDGKNKGLGILKGSVEKIPSAVKVPHMGWNELKILKRNSKIFSGIKERENFYFVHSYHVIPDSKDIISSTTDYGIEIVAGIEYDNIYGFQFHPEKSSDGGLKLLENFWNIAKERKR
ncbi:MAG: imidazole glycerol phosphate synthase, glutamine amidotransferase subunit [Actinobacteria bacterium RBG_13_35_12]|nr:MAG: imidazole glycerol phosphate synthase, glutamine amidotransferase subunit [Actinobacteria bacterium RBG_13_35_12]